MEYILIKDIEEEFEFDRGLVIGNSYDVDLNKLYTHTKTKEKFHSVRESEFSVDRKSFFISEKELAEHFIEKKFYKRRNIIEDLL